MKKSRTFYTVTNIVFGLLNRVVNIIFPFIIRSVMIYTLGTEYLGLNTLFSSILQVLNLAEMGLSSAIVYSMYKPMAENKTDEICALLFLYKKIYKIIGCIVLLIGMGIIPFLPNLIHGTYPENANLISLYIIYLINTSISYFFNAYKTAIWNATQQVSVLHGINTIIIFIQSVVQIILLVITKNYMLYLIIMPLCTLLNNFIISIITSKKFPQYKCCGDVSKNVIESIKQRVIGLFITKICTTTRNSLDSIFISAFLGLNAVAIYGNYYYIMGAVFSIMGIITASMTSSIGNSMVKESKQKNYHDMRKFNFLFSWITGLCTTALLCLYQPFMKMWVGEKMMLPYYMVILFSVYFYVLCLGSIRSVYHDAAGLWWEARYRAILETISNIVLNYVLTLLFGIGGTVLSTIISILIINYGYGTSIVFKHYFKGISMKQYFMDHLKYTIVIIIASIITINICNLIKLDGIIDFVIKGIMCMIIPNVIFCLVYRNNIFYKEFVATVKKMLNIIK